MLGGEDVELWMDVAIVNFSALEIGIVDVDFYTYWYFIPVVSPGLSLEMTAVAFLYYCRTRIQSSID